MRQRVFKCVLLAIACTAATAAADQTAVYRQRYAIADTLDVTSAEVADQSPVDGPVSVVMHCKLDRPGSYAFRFDPVRADGRAEVVTVVSPMPPPSPHRAILPGGIHGGPPRVLPGGPAPTVSRDAKDPDQITVRWTYGDTAGRGGSYGMKLAGCTFSAPAASRPTTQPTPWWLTLRRRSSRSAQR